MLGGRWAATLAALLAVGTTTVLTGCGAAESDPIAAAGPECSDHPPAVIPEGLSGTLTLTPPTASPGETFTAGFPEQRSRTRMLFMTAGGPAVCARAFLLTGRHWEELPKDGRFGSIDVERPRRSVTAVVPRIADPGVYLICDEDTEACALLTVSV